MMSMLRSAAAALLMLANSAQAVDLVVNGQLTAGLTSWAAAPSTTGSAAGTCGYNGVTAPGTETLTSTPGFPALNAATTNTALGSISLTGTGFRSCVLYQDIAIPAGATTAVLSLAAGIKLVGGLASGDTAIFVGLYPATAVPSFQLSSAVGGTLLIVGGAINGPAMVQQGPVTINVRSVAGTTVRLAIINAMQSTSSGTGAFVPGAGSVIGIGDVKLDVTVPAVAPGAPTVGAASAGNAQATVTFTAPASNGGSAVTGYTATSSPGGITATGAASPIVVPGLTNGTAYTFTVTATNAIGTGAASAASNSVTPVAVPGAPTIGAATAGNAQATVAFTAPASNGGSAVTGYTVTSAPGGITATGAASPIVVPGLTNGTAYTFIVTATNAIGTGPASAASNSVTPKLASFSAPTATGSGVATASFTGGGAGCSFAPAGNGPLQSAYFIPLTGHPKSPPAGSAPAQVTFAQGLLDFVLIGCTPGSTVSFTVTYATPLPPSTTYWKYGPTASDPAPHWYVLPSSVAGNTVTFNITDGGLGDDDLAANGTVVDQGGPGAPGVPASVVQVPTLSEWMLMLLAGLMMVAAMRRVHGSGRRSAH
jgi:hypothetical protein